jgi:hypothetical protein
MTPQEKLKKLVHILKRLQEYIYDETFVDYNLFIKEWRNKKGEVEKELNVNLENARFTLMIFNDIVDNNAPYHTAFSTDVNHLEEVTGCLYEEVFKALRMEGISIVERKIERFVEFRDRIENVENDWEDEDDED